jgi:hypothetical protein
MLGWSRIVRPLAACVAASLLSLSGRALGAQPGNAAPTASAGQPRVYSARDAIGWSVESVIEELRELPTPASAEPAAASSRSQALATARQIASRRSTPALRAFLDSTRRNPQELRRLAAFAAMNGGEGAMAFLLAAEQRRPGDWATQYNIAAFLLLEGYPRAALGILDSLRAPAGAAGPGGLDLRATLLLGRGNALLASGRPRQAIPLLREARRLEPVMAEAARSLARAHLLLNEEEEAKRVLRAGGRRFASTAAMEDAGRLPPITDPDITIEDAILVEAMKARGGNGLSLNDRWPLRKKGHPQSLPVMPLPSAPETVKPFLQELEVEVEKRNGEVSSTMGEVQTTAVPFASDPRPWALGALRTQLLADVQMIWLPSARTRFLCADPSGFAHTGDDRYNRTAVNASADSAYAAERLEDPELAYHARSMRRTGAAICERVLDPMYWQRFMDDLRVRIDRCPNGPGYERCACQARRTVAGAQLASLNEVWQPYIGSVKRWYSVAHHHSTAVAGYVERKDKTLRAVVRANIESSKAMVAASVHGPMLDFYRNIETLCDPEPKTPGDSLATEGTLGSWPDEACSSADGMGVKQDVVVAEIKLSCYEVEVEGKVPLPVPGFNAIGSVTYTFGGPDETNIGNITIFTGAGVDTPGIGGVEVAAKAGTYVTFNGGEVKDGGVKLSAEASAGNVVKEVSASFSGKEFALDAAGAATYVSDSFLALLSP